MDCPRCGAPSVSEPSCPRCGVIFAKLHTQPPHVEPEKEPETPRQSSGLGVLFLCLLLAGGIAFLTTRPRSKAAPASLPIAFQGSTETLPPAPPVSVPEVSPPPPIPSSGISPEDFSVVQGLVARLSHRASFENSDVETAERLYAKYPESPVRNLLQGVLWAATNTSLTRRRTPEAITFLRRLIVLDPKGRAREALVEAYVDASDWPSAETAAREGLALDPKNARLLGNLGYALLRQDRNSEAEEQLRASLEIQEDPRFRQYLRMLQTQLRTERGMTEQRIAHFDVRYDGESNEEVGREILRALERHYATLARVLDHELQTKVPVVLLSREQYYNQEGNPFYYGGHYSPEDARIRVPIRGLSASSVAELDATLLHELTHAFVHDLSQDVVPRHVNEGLAQFMEGKRFAAFPQSWGPTIAGFLTPNSIAALAREGGSDWRFSDVRLTYVFGLSFVEYLEESSGQGNINTLLKAAGETRSIDQAFQRAYGRSSAEIHSAWAQRVRQQYGS